MFDWLRLRVQRKQHLPLATCHVQQAVMLPHDSIVATYSIWLLYNVANWRYRQTEINTANAEQEEQEKAAPVAVTKVAQTLPDPYTLPASPVPRLLQAGSDAVATALPTNEFLI